MQKYLKTQTRRMKNKNKAKFLWKNLRKGRERKGISSFIWKHSFLKVWHRQDNLLKLKRMSLSNGLWYLRLSRLILRFRLAKGRCNKVNPSRLLLSFC